MSTLNPRDPYVSQDLGETFLKLQRLPLLKRVQVFNKLRQQAHSEASHRTAGFVANLMLVEAPVGIARGLPHVQTLTSWTTGVVQQNHIH